MIYLHSALYYAWFWNNEYTCVCVNRVQTFVSIYIAGTKRHEHTHTCTVYTYTKIEWIISFSSFASLRVSVFIFTKNSYDTEHSLGWANIFWAQVRMLRTSMEFLFRACWLIYEWIQSLAPLPSQCLWRTTQNSIYSFCFVSFASPFLMALLCCCCCCCCDYNDGQHFELRISISNRFRSFQSSVCI